MSKHGKGLFNYYAIGHGGSWGLSKYDFALYGGEGVGQNIIFHYAGGRESIPNIT